MNFTGQFKRDLYLSLMKDGQTLAGMSVTYTCPMRTHGIWYLYLSHVYTWYRLLMFVYLYFIPLIKEMNTSVMDQLRQVNDVNLLKMKSANYFNSYTHIHIQK